MDRLTHFNEDGKAHMVDISGKDISERTASACGSIRMNEEAFNAVKEGTAAKGDVLGAARIAGIMGAKRTWELIPLCHQIQLTSVEISFTMEEETGSITCCCKVRATGKTGAEMEAMTAVHISLLTIYDMCKALDRSMVMTDIHLVEKDGGKSGYYHV